MIEQSYTIKAPIDVVWKALTDATDIKEWTGTEAIMDDQEGTEFKLWNGDIHGKNITVSENDELVQEWYSGDWKEPSTVTFTLTKLGENTKLNILHEGVPEDEVEEIEDGWKEYYIDPLKEYVEQELA